MLREPDGIPGSIRDLLATLDLWCDLSPVMGHHLRDGAHLLTPGRFGAVVVAPETGRPYLVGPLCADCLATVSPVVLQWAEVYESGDVCARFAPWCQAVRLVGR